VGVSNDNLRQPVRHNRSPSFTGELLQIIHGLPSGKVRVLGSSTTQLVLVHGRDVEHMPAGTPEGCRRYQCENPEQAAILARRMPSRDARSCRISGARSSPADNIFETSKCKKSHWKALVSGVSAVHQVARRDGRKGSAFVLLG
jgi:hypothetical protein